MRLTRLTLENFRGFESLELELDPQLTVLVGANGSGKTSILDALVYVLAEHVGSTLVSPSDYRKGTASASIGYEVRPFGDGEASRYTMTFEGADAVVTKTLSGPAAASVEWATTQFCPYPVRRQAVPFPIQAPKHDTTLADHWKSEVDFSDFFTWFIGAEDIENERRRDDPSHRESVLEAVRQAVERLMPGYTALRVRRSKSRSQPSLTLVKDGLEFDLQQLSDGERALAVLAGDIAWRTAITGGGHRGIVIIDEVDLHLHPKWQANVLPALLRTFPEIQFIVTSHSPIVLSHIDAEHLRLLENFQLVAVPPTRGRDPNSLLSEVFGVPLRPRETQERIDHIAELIDEEHLDEAKQELRLLGAQLGPTDLEVTRLRGIVELMEA